MNQRDRIWTVVACLVAGVFLTAMSVSLHPWLGGSFCFHGGVYSGLPFPAVHTTYFPGPSGTTMMWGGALADVAFYGVIVGLLWRRFDRWLTPRHRRRVGGR